MYTIDGKEFDVGSTVQFTTKHPYDENFYKGTVVAICKYKIARAFNTAINDKSVDIAAYHLVIRDQTDGYVGELEDLDFFILDSEKEKNVPFAFNWVSPGSFSLVSYTDTITIKIYDIDSETETAVIQKLLTDNGYRNRVLS